MATPHAFRHLLGVMMIEDVSESGGAPAPTQAPAPTPAPTPASAPPAFPAWTGGYRGDAGYAPVFYDMSGNIIADAYSISGSEFYSPSRDTRYQNVAWSIETGDSTEPNYNAFPWLRNALEMYGWNIQIGATDAEVNYSEIQYGPSVPWVAAPAPAPAPAPVGIPWVAPPGYGIPPAVTESWGLPSYVAPGESVPAAPGVVAVVNPDTGQVQYTSPHAAPADSGLPVVAVITPATPPAPGQVVSAGGGVAPDTVPAVGGSWVYDPETGGQKFVPAPSNARALILAALAALAFLN